MNQLTESTYTCVVCYKPFTDTYTHTEWNTRSPAKSSKHKTYFRLLRSTLYRYMPCFCGGKIILYGETYGSDASWLIACTTCKYIYDED